MFYSLLCCLLTPSTLHYLVLGGCLVYFILFMYMKCKDIVICKKSKNLKFEIITLGIFRWILKATATFEMSTPEFVKVKKIHAKPQKMKLGMKILIILEVFE